MAKKSATHATDTASPGTSLVICRNKHWRYISSFHGPWLQLPVEILESLAHQNYSMPAPRLIDPAIFYDVVKIRRAVDEAAQESVRASIGMSNTAMSGRMDHFGAGGAPGSQLSKERIFKIRQKAVKQLSGAFALDEVAASVATMQATSTLEDVGSHVLKRDPSSPEAKYVHFFHEKIPSRAIEQHTSLGPLDEVISSLPFEQQAAPLRTRALVRLFKHQWEAAALDFTSALRITTELRNLHQPNQQQLELASKMREDRDTAQQAHKDWKSAAPLKEEDQPKSMEMQLLFNRAGVYLTIACESVHPALDGLKDYLSAEEEGSLGADHVAAQELRLEARKRVKTNAKRALKDYLAFLSHFEYTPGLSYEVTNEMMQRIYDLANGHRLHTAASRTRLLEHTRDGRDPESGLEAHSSALVKHQRLHPRQPQWTEDGWPLVPPAQVFRASDLFAERPLPDLPPFPHPERTADKLGIEAIKDAFGSREAVTYHPLLTDALHSLLLAHALLQTSPTELLRHAHNVARLARIADGYPIFQAARSPARADWIEVLRRANNWLGLSIPWQKLCAPAPLPDAAGGWAKARSTTASKRGTAAKDESADQKRERIKQESIIDALSDDRVVDEESFQRAVRAREQRAIEDDQGLSGPLKDKVAVPASPTNKGAGECAPEHAPSFKRWAQDENGREYPISTDRAEAIARWIKEAPLSMGGKRRKVTKKKRSRIPGVADTAATFGGMTLRNDEGDDNDDRPD